MDEEITIQSFTATRDASGQQVLTFSDYVTTLARVQWPEAGLKETYSADQQTAFRKVVFWVRYDPDINEKMRILYRQIEIADILGKRTEGRDRFLAITCQLREETIDYLTDDSGNALTDDSGNILTP